MTDEKGVGGLPDAGTIEPGDPGHIEVHDQMSEIVQFAAERSGIILDPPAPPPAVVGEYGHVQAHNTLLANLEQLAAEGGGGGAFGTPGPVTIVEEGDSVIKFTAGEEGDAGPTLAFGATVEPNDNGEQVLVEADPAVGGDVIVNNTQLNTDYIVTIYGVNLAGLGEPTSTKPFQVNYNIAEGGTETIEDGYNGTNQKWKVHRMPRGGQNAVRESTFTVIQSPVPFRVLIVGSGGQASNPCGSGGGGGAVYHSDTEELDRGDYICKVPGGALKQTENQTGLPAEAFGHKANGGGTSPGGGGNVSSSITGKSEIFGRGNYSNCQTSSGNGHGGKVQTSDCSNGAWGCAGNGGDVIVAYQIGFSTTREIEVARQRREAEQDAYESGVRDGMVNATLDDMQFVESELREIDAALDAAALADEQKRQTQ